MHSTSKIHDAVVDEAKAQYMAVGLSEMTADRLANWPTMPATAIYAIQQETTRSVREAWEGAINWLNRRRGANACP
jgi:hypothetical protein